METTLAPTTAFIVAGTCTALIRAIWIRRRSFVSRCERAKLAQRCFTTSLVLQLAALVLKSPPTQRTIAPLLHATFGQWNLDEWAADSLVLGAVGLIAVHVSCRLNLDDERMFAAIKQHFQWPMTVFVPILLALLTQSPNAAGHEWPDMFDCPTDHWLDAYWTIMAVFLGYMLTWTTVLLMVVRRDDQSCATATFYISACVLGVVGCILRIVTTWTDENYTAWFWIVECAVAFLFAHGAVQSWRQKVRSETAKQDLPRA